MWSLCAFPVASLTRLGWPCRKLLTVGVDAVSQQLRDFGFWEFASVDEVLSARGAVSTQGMLRFAPRTSLDRRKPQFLDLGSNLGFYSLLFAADGWSVLAIEAMEHNRRPLRASLCLNPQLDITLVPAALGSANAAIARTRCVATSIERNRGNGRLECGEAAKAINCSALVHSGRCKDTKRGQQMSSERCKGGSYDVAFCEEVRLRSVDEILHEAKVIAVDAIKVR